jgi:hypothetical protein
MWLKVAESLPSGHKERIDCTNLCGGGKTMVVNHHVTHYSCYCHRCGFKTGRDKGYQTLEQIARVRAQDDLARANVRTMKLPSDCEYDPNKWTPEARLWLYGASIYGNLLTTNRLSFSPSLNRVCLPTFEGDELKYYQLRRIGVSGPKYVNPSIDKSALIHYCGTGSTSIVICEDILSTIRVGQHTRSASLLGTKITTAQAGMLSEYPQVYTWLDNDKAGIDGALSYRRAVALLGCETKNINTEKDPKEYSSDDIKSILLEHTL